MVPSTLIDLVRLRAASRPAASAYTFLSEGEEEEASITYQMLETRARATGAWLQAHTAAGSRVLLLFPPGLDYITAFFGCLFAGVIAVPTYPPRTRANRGQGRLSAIVQDASVAMALTNSVVASSLRQPERESNELADIPACLVDDIPAAWAENWRDPSAGPDTTAFLQYTSGSTSLPKGVMVSHANLIENQRMIQRACRHDEDSTFAGWLPLYHDMGLIGNVLQPLYIGARCVLMSPAAFLQKPVRWLRAISRYRAHTSGGPNFAYELCTRRIAPQDLEGVDLSSWAVAFNGAEPVRQETIDRFSELFAACGFRKAAFCPVYGLAEATLMVSGERRAGPSANSSPGESAVSCGPPVIETSIAIVDPDRKTPCAPDEIGEIWVSGPGVAQGYWNRPSESDEIFRAQIAGGDGRAFLRTGDLGYFRGGELYVTGRLKDIIIIRGLNHHAEDIEWTAQRCDPAVTTAAAFAVEEAGSEELAIALELHRSAASRMAELADDIRQAISERHDLRAHAILFAKAGAIPKTSSGKVQRQLCRKLFLEGRLETAWSDVSGVAAPSLEVPSPIVS